MKRVLVVEEDPHLAEAVSDVLSDADLRVTHTPSGAEALLLLNAQPVDLVFVDLGVTDLHGLGVASTVSDFAKVPVIATSTGENWQREAFASGAHACLSKPYGIRELLSLVRGMLAEKRPGDPFGPDVEALSHEDVDRLLALTPEEQDALPFGLIRIDPAGTILSFNAYESSASGFPPQDVVGRRFVDIAPCVKVRRFMSALDEVRATLGSTRVLRFRFPRFDAESVVSVRLFHDPGTHGLWLFVSESAARRE